MLVFEQNPFAIADFCGIIAAKQLLYQNDGQDDTQAQPAPVLMANDTTSLRNCGIIAAKQL
ncbi:hypothetical protein D7Y41_13810 [Anaerotruncus sp. 1XD22-93]|nr:hypothetical protein D7Y41_13810 [Anaerotruncus sp. 1XD22-93]